MLADALCRGAETAPDLMVSMATLTGAARVALGPDLAPFFTDDDALAENLARAAPGAADPVWRLPFWVPYEADIEPGIADLDNAPSGGMGGAITAALFLRRFAEGAPRYAHFDIYGWQPKDAPARPRGGSGTGRAHPARRDRDRVPPAMTDRRDTPDPAVALHGTPARIARPVTDLLSRPGGPRDRQLLLGESITILGRTGGHGYVRAAKDGYHGYVATGAIGDPRPPTHRISAAASHVYSAPDIKSADLLSLGFGSRVTATAETADFIETDLGYIPEKHVRPADSVEPDPVAVAMLFLGTPYLWGGNTIWGIDCSGLVQAAFLACGHACPGDSDQQQRHFGAPLGDTTPRRRGDLLFWHGHVALAMDENRLVHANAHHMVTVAEDAHAALTRLADHGLPLVAHIRP